MSWWIELATTSSTWPRCGPGSATETDPAINIRPRGGRARDPGVAFPNGVELWSGLPELFCREWIEGYRAPQRGAYEPIPISFNRHAWLRFHSPNPLADQRNFRGAHQPGCSHWRS